MDLAARIELSNVLQHQADKLNVYIEPDGYVLIADLLTLPQFEMYSEDDVLYVAQRDRKKVRVHLKSRTICAPHSRRHVVAIFIVDGLR